MKCQWCHSAMKKTDKFCSHCGRDVMQPFKEFVPSDHYKLPKKIVTLIKESGHSYKQIAKELQKCKGFENYKLSDLWEMVYTEDTYWSSEQNLKPLENDNHIKKYKISFIDDEFTCEKCKEKAKYEFYIKHRKRGVNMPPFHSYCRCGIIFVVPDLNEMLEKTKK